MRLISIIAALFMAFCLFACGKDVAGTATQTENTVASGELDSLKGVVFHKDGSRANGAIVRMVLPNRRVDFEKGELRETLTDTQGQFLFLDVPTDTFQLAVIDSALGEILYMPKASAQGDSLVVVLDQGAVVKGYLTYDDSVLSSISVGSHFIVYVDGGLPIYETVFAPGGFELLVPEGSWTLGFCPGDPQVVEKLQESGVQDSLIYRSLELPKVLKKGESYVVDTLKWGLERKPAVSEKMPESSSSSKVQLDAKDSVETPVTPKAWISGQVDCSNLDVCDSVEVMIITDLFGFAFKSGEQTEFEIQARTDTQGRWWLPAPEEVPYDSFRVEYRQRSGNKVTNVGLSRYVKKAELKDLKDTLSIGMASLSKYSWLSAGVRLVVDQENGEQTENCFMNSVVLGIEGTSHFIRTVTCNMHVLTYLPSGTQRLLMYSGDPVVVSALQEAGVPLAAYVNSSDQNLTSGNGIKELWLTFTPPSSK